MRERRRQRIINEESTYNVASAHRVCVGVFVVWPVGILVVLVIALGVVVSVDEGEGVVIVIGGVHM